MNSTGASVGLLCVWDWNVFVIKKKKVSGNCIALLGEIVATKQTLLMINVYNTRNRKDKRKVQEDLVALIVEYWSKSCLVLGDSNSTHSSEERLNGKKVSSRLEGSQQILSFSGLIDLKEMS